MIDWEASYGAGWIRRFAAAPLFEAGSSLLASAALCWQGRYGAGRVVGAAAGDLASEMKEFSRYWREQALGWTANLLCEDGGQVNFYLRRFADRRSFSMAHDAAALKHPMAARRIVQFVLEAAEDRLRGIAESGDRSHGYKEARRWEDRIETLGETSLGVPPRPELDDAQREALERFAVFRMCESLASCAESFLRHGRGRDWYKKEAPKAEKAWDAEAERFRGLAKDSYRRFAACAPEDERAAILSVRDDALPYHEFSDAHYGGRTADAQAEAIYALFISLTLRTVGAHADWDARVLGRAIKAAGIDMKTLGSGTKALPERASR